MRFFAILSSCLSVAAAASLSKRAPTPGQVSQVTNYGGPTAAQFWIYVPKSLKASPGVMAAVHYCTGSGQGYANQAPYKNLAEKYGFIAIFPGSPHSGGCWDVSSKGTLTHEGGGDSNSIANMVKWAIKEYNVDTNKVFVQGESSGAMMTNVLAATYPDLFKAGVVYSGVNAGCFMSSSNGVAAWNGTCANGQSIATPQAWGQVAKNMYPGYNGTRPKMLIYHGGADSTLRPQNYQETMKQWSGVFGYNYDQPESTKQNDPQSGYVRTTYGPLLQGVYAQSVGHSVPLRGEDDMKWFGFA